MRVEPLTYVLLTLNAAALAIGAAAASWWRVRRWQARLTQIEQLIAAGTMAAGVAHEVKNPLVGVVGFAQLGQVSTDVTEMREYFALIEKDALFASALLDGMLDFSRPLQAVEFQTHSVNELVHRSLALVAHQLHINQVTLETRLADALPTIRGDANQLRQVLINVLLNASQAVANSTVKKVLVSTRREGAKVAIVVQDSGPGLSAEAKRQVFTPFFTTKPRGQGTGLGLALSKTLVEGHGGTLTITSEPGQGAQVTLVLPPGL